MKSKNQEWPEVPEMEKIEEQNPELLAMKILESGRQLEANKMKNNDPRRETSRNSTKIDRNVSNTQTKGSHFSPSYSPSVPSPSISPSVNSSAFFEDRIKNIITCALNEDNKPQSYPRSLNESWSSPKPNLNSSSSAFVNNEIDNLVPNSSEPSNKSNLPDYTQVSPAKLALRRHLSQEKVASQSPNFIGTRTIGDLVSGEIERTLEISNQSIINTVVPMCLNPNNSSLTKNDFTEALIQKSLANQFHNRNSNSAKHGENGGKVNNNASPHSNQYNINSKNSRSSVLYSANSSSQFVPYAPKYPNTHVSRADAKSYHDPYFSEMKSTKEEPVEG